MFSPGATWNSHSTGIRRSGRRRREVSIECERLCASLDVRAGLKHALAHLQGPQDGAGGVHEEEAQVAENIGEGKQALSHQDGVESVPVLPLSVAHMLELREQNEKI